MGILTDTEYRNNLSIGEYEILVEDGFIIRLMSPRHSIHDSLFLFGMLRSVCTYIRISNEKAFEGVLAQTFSQLYE